MMDFWLLFSSSLITFFFTSFKSLSCVFVLILDKHFFSYAGFFLVKVSKGIIILLYLSTSVEYIQPLVMYNSSVIE